jgi:hypothetical protein
MLTFPPYAGQTQQQVIDTPSSPAAEDGPNAVRPYPKALPEGSAIVPPPLAKTDLWSAQQTFPL